jgi:pimeloyl-ACP methyl ester carboxylesterase
LIEPEYAALKGGGRLAYTVRGEGPALLLLRPVGGSMLSWTDFADALAKRARVISFDARGLGASSEAPPTITTRQMAVDAIALLDHLKLERAHVFGLSLGGMVASWMAVDAPARVERLILAATLPRGLGVRAGAVVRGLKIASCLAKSPADAEACLVSRILSSHFRRENPEAVLEIQRVARLRPATHRGLLTMLQAAARHDVRDRLRDIVAATRVIVGQYDPLLTLSSQRTLLADIPGASFDVIDGAGHDLSLEAPNRTADHVLRFIEMGAAQNNPS